MKKISLSMAALLLLVAFSNAQNTAPYWSLAGNSTATVSSKLGTTNLIPLRLLTNNVERVRITENGRVGIGITTPLNIFTVKASGGTPAASWLNGVTSPVIVAFANAMSSELVLAGASTVPNERAVFQGRRSRGTTTAPLVVANNDYITSLLASAYDGSAFQSPALVSFFVDGTPSAGNVPARISLVTGSNYANRKERLKVGSTGNFDFNSGQVYLQQSNGFLGIGTVAPSQKLHVVGKGLITDSLIAGSITAGSANKSVGVKGTGSNYGVFGSSTYLGVYGNSTYTGVYGEGGSYGVYGFSSANRGVAGYSTTGYGVFGSGNYGVYGTSSNYGVYGTSGYVGVFGNGTSYGLNGSGRYGLAGTGSYIGVFGTSTDGTAVVGNCTNGTGGNFFSNNGYGLVAGTGRTDKNWAAVFNGNTYAYGAYQTSDRKLKQNIQELGDAMTIINQLKPKSYEFRKEGKAGPLNLPSGKHYGFIAQELEEILPNLVKEVLHINNGKIPAEAAEKALENGIVMPPKEQNSTEENITIKAVNYIELIPVLIKGMQEQQAQIQEQQKQIDQLQALLKTNMRQGAHGLPLTPGGYLTQNMPNPAQNNTVINYFLAGNTGRAQIKITDSKGSDLKVYDVSKGNGQLNIKSGEFPSGTYSYSLYVNGKKIDTKQMVITR